MITATPARTTSSLLLPWGLSRSVSNPIGPTARRRIPRSPNGKVGFLHCRRSWSCGLFSEDKELFGSMGTVLSVPEGVDYVPYLTIGPPEFMDSKVPYYLCRGIIYPNKWKHDTNEICSRSDLGNDGVSIYAGLFRNIRAGVCRCHM